MAKLFAKSGYPDQMLHSVVSDLGLKYLPNTYLEVSRLKLVKDLLNLRNQKTAILQPSES